MNFGTSCERSTHVAESESIVHCVRYFGLVCTKGGNSPALTFDAEKKSHERATNSSQRSLLQEAHPTKETAGSRSRRYAYVSVALQTPARRVVVPRSLSGLRRSFIALCRRRREGNSLHQASTSSILEQ